MRHYAYCAVAVILLVCGIIYLLSSCTTEVEITGKPGERTGPKVTVNFSLNIGIYTDEAIEPRSFNASEPVTDFVHIAQGVYMYATLEEDNPVRTRATTNLPIGTQVRIVAFDSIGVNTYTIADQKDYIVSATGLLTPQTIDLAVTSGRRYKFAAYSFNNNSIPAISSGSTTAPFTVDSYNPDLDLLWGITGLMLIDAVTSLETVDIIMNHLFSRVRVEASTEEIEPVNSIIINAIVNPRVSPHYGGSSTTLNVLTGALNPPGAPNAAGTPIPRWRDFDTGTHGTLWRTGGGTNTFNFASPKVESDYRIIFTNNANELALLLDQLIVNNRGLGDREWRFTKRLLPGHSYTLKLNFKRLVWAGSNIFWDGSMLTFLPENTMVAEVYQGVYFLWGSLIGISPAATAANDAATAGPTGNFSATNLTGTKLYVPPGTGGNAAAAYRTRGWTTTYAANGLLTTKPWSATGLANIPRVAGGVSLVSPGWLDDHSARNYLYSDVPRADTMYFRGDICRYLSDLKVAPPGYWRMPNAREFGEVGEYVSTMLYSLASGLQVSRDGRSDYSSGQTMSFVTKSANTVTIFPAGGSRAADANGTYQLNQTRYWSGSPANNTTLTAARNLRISTTLTPGISLTDHATVGPFAAGQFSVQALVRCVKLDEENIPVTFLNLLPTADIEDWISGGTIGGTDTQGQIWYGW